MNFFADEILIITSSIKPVKNITVLAITDPKERLFQTYCSLIDWLKNTKIKQIVLCDNTGVEHDFSEIFDLAQQQEKQIEILVFNSNQEKVIELGKGFGEGEIMKYAIKHSRLLRNATSFYKVTGRVSIANFNNLYDTHRSQTVVFDYPPLKKQKRILWEFAANFPFLMTYLRNSGKGFVPTVFYKCDVDYYTDNLMECYTRVNVHKNFYLEHSFFLPIVKKEFNTFFKKPLLIGYSGSTGKLYNNIDYSNDVKDLARRLLGYENPI